MQKLLEATTESKTLALSDLLKTQRLQHLSHAQMSIATALLRVIDAECSVALSRDEVVSAG